MSHVEMDVLHCFGSQQGCWSTTSRSPKTLQCGASCADGNRMAHHTSYHQCTDIFGNHWTCGPVSYHPVGSLQLFQGSNPPCCVWRGVPDLGMKHGAISEQFRSVCSSPYGAHVASGGLAKCLALVVRQLPIYSLNLP
jgi:hypothetical protein